MGRFPSAASALSFAGQVDDLGYGETLVFGHSASTAAWWTGATLPLDVGREILDGTGGQPYVQVGESLMPDRGWGAPPAGDADSGRSGEGGAPLDLVRADVLDLIKVSGLHASARPIPNELVVLLPGVEVASLVQRALDLGVEVQYRLARVEPLFSSPQVSPSSAQHVATPPEAGTSSAESADRRGMLYELVLRRTPAPPQQFVDALNRNPFVLVCRRVGTSVLIQHGMTSALPDRCISSFADRDGHPGLWVLADATFGCHRLAPVQEEASDGASLIHLDDTYELVEWAGGEEEAEAGWPGSLAAAMPEPPRLRLTPASTRGVDTDAILLGSEDLATIPILLEGRPLADIAMLCRGRDQHLLLAPGSLLERLPVGEPLYRIGPGHLYLPIGHRLQPSLPPTARHALFPTDERTAIAVVHSDLAVAFDLESTRPVWTLWAGQLPPIDLQVPTEALAALSAAGRLVDSSGDGVATGQSGRIGLLDRARHAFSNRPAQAKSWRDEAWEAERAGDLVTAAELHEAHNDLRRAAHLYELAARQENADPLAK